MSEAPDAGHPPDAGHSPDTGHADTGHADTGQADVGQTDTGQTDTGQTDTGRADTGQADAGQADAGQTDTGQTDAGQADAGQTDAGQADAGHADGGQPDAGQAGNSQAGGGQAPPDGKRDWRVPVIAGVVVVGLLVAAGLTWMNRPHRHAGTAVSEGSGGSGSGNGSGGAAIGGVRLTGTVVDGTGAPVVGVDVSAQLEQGAVDRSLAGPAGSATAPVAVGGGGDTIVRAPPTAKDGRFVIGGLVAGRYRLRVSGPGLVPAEVRYVPVPSDEARIVIARQVSVDGKVVDGGVAVPDAMVGLRGEAIGGVLEQKADAKGEFHFANLPEGRYQVYAWQAALAARAVRVNRLGAGPFTPVELRLEAATIVVGRVVDREEGVGLSAAVELRPSGDDQAPRYARTGDDGVFRIEGVPTGTWIADAFAYGYASSGGVELTAGRGVPELALTRGGTIEGQVLDGDGKPIAGASVRALVGGAAGAGAGGDVGASDSATVEQSAAVDQDKLRRFSGRIAAAAAASVTAAVGAGDPDLLPRGELGVTVGPIPPIPPPGAQVARPASIDPTAAGGNVLVGEPPPLGGDPARASIWTTGPDGRYRIRGVPRGKATVLALASGYAEGRSKQVAVELGQTITKIDIVLSSGTIISGRVLDGRGAPVAGAQVSVVADVGGGRLDAFTDGEGRYRIGPVAGAVELSATAYGHGVARKKLELAPARGSVPAERTEDLVLAVADAMLAGTLDDATGAPVAGGTLEIVGGGAGEGRRAVTGADGTFSLDMLPSGPVRLRIVHPDYPPAEVDAVAATGTPARVRLRLPLGGAVEGVLLDASSGAGLAGIAVSGAGPNGSTTDATTDKDGRWRLGPLAPGHWRVSVAQPGYRPLAREVDVPAARAPGVTSVRDVRLDLQRGALVGGTVRDGRGQRVANATVTVQAVGDASGGGGAEGTTDSAGEFRIRDCPTGELSLAASRGAERGTIRVTIRPGDEVLGLAIEIR